MNAIATEFTAASEEAPRASSSEQSREEWFAERMARPILPTPRLVDAGVPLNPQLAAAVAAVADRLDGYEKIARAHTAAEIASGDSPSAEAAFKAADDMWHAALDELDEKMEALLEAPAEGPELMVRAGAYLRAAALRALRQDQWRELTIQEAAEIVEDGMPGSEADLGAVLRSIIEAPQPTHKWEPITWDQAEAIERWNAALAAYQTAAAAYTKVDADSEAAHAALYAALPEGLDREVRGKRLPAYHSLRQFDEDRLIPHDRREALRPLLVEWLAKYEAAKPLLAQVDERQEAADLAQEAALDALIEVYPPTPAARAEKLRLQSIRVDDDLRGYDDLGYLAFHLGHYLPERYTAQNYLDALQAAGMLSHPAFTIGDFRPRDWISAFKDTGGGVSVDYDKGLLLGRPYGRDEHVERAAALTEELVQTPWKMRAVWLVAHDRRRDGYDPLYEINTDLRSKARLCDLHYWTQVSDGDGEPLATPRIRFMGEPR